MQLYQKLIFIKAIGITTLSNKGNVLEIIKKYDALITEGEESSNEEARQIFKEILSTVNVDNCQKGLELVNALIKRFPDRRQDYTFHKINLLLLANDLEAAITTTNEYIAEFGEDTEVVLRKVEALMSLDYENNLEEIETLMLKVKEKILKE